MQHARKPLGLALLLVLAALATSAAAATHEATLGPAKTVFEWDGSPDVGLNIAYNPALPCDVTLPVTACEETLLNVDVADGTGITLTVDVPETGDDDFDVYVYKSDKDGAVGDEAGVSDNGSPAAEQVVIANAKGFYLVRVVYFTNTTTAYHGKATLTGLPEVVETPVPTVEPAPAPAPSSSPPPPPPPPPGPGPAPAAAPAPAPTATPAPADLRARVSLRRTRVRTARRSGLPVRVACSEACNATLRARIDGRTARRLGLGRRAQTIGRVALQMSPELGSRYRLQLSPRARRALRRGTLIRVSARITDLDGKRPLAFSNEVTLR